MNAALAVFRLEIKERSRVFIVALALAVLPFAVSAIPSLAGQRSYAIAAIGIWGALIYGLSVAFVTGASTLGRALAEKRMSFYLVRPISPAALWGGKLLGGVGIAFTAAAIIAIPAILAAPRESRVHLGLFGDGLSVVLLAGVPALFLIANVASTFVRSRSIRVAFDFVCLLLAAAAVVFIVRPVIVGGAMEATGRALLAGAIAVALLMAVAPVWQIARGRSVMKDSHAALSNAFWAGVAGVVLVLGGWSAWVTRAPFESIRTYGAGAQSSDGEWLVVGGETTRAGFHTTWLVNTKTREKERLGAVLPWSGSEISADGRTLVTAHLGELFPKTGATELRFTALRDGGVEGVVRTSEWTGTYALNADASRVVTATSSGLTAWEPSTGKMLAAAQIDGRRVATLYFVSPDVVRATTRQNHSNDFEIHEFDVAKKTMRRTGGCEGEGGSVVASEDGSRVFLGGLSGRVINGQTGETLMQLPGPLFGTMLRDGRVTTVTRGGERAVLTLYGVDGAVQRTIELPGSRAHFVGQMSDSKVFVRVVGYGDGIALVDLERGSIVSTIEGARSMPTYVDHRLMQIPADGAVVGLDANKKLAAWEVATGKKREL